MRIPALLLIAVLIASLAGLSHPIIHSIESKALARPERSAPAARERAPDFSLQDAAGRTVRLSDLRGKVVIVEFWATWCGPCVRGLPVLADVARREGSGVVFLAINSDDNESGERVRDFLAARKLDLRALLRGAAVAKRFGVGPIPHTVVIARDGIIVAKHVGFSNENAVRDQLQRDIAVAKSRR